MDCSFKSTKKLDLFNIIYTYIYIKRFIGLVGRVRQWSGRPKTLKMVRDTFLLNTQQCMVRIKSKVGQSGERSRNLSYTSV